MAYFLYHQKDDAAASYSLEWVDGDYDKVSIKDTQPDDGVGINSVLTHHLLVGRPVEKKHIPTKLKSSFTGHTHPDYEGGGGLVPYVSEGFKSVVEALEPGVHQFFPFDIISAKGEIRESMYLMVVCNRLDGVNSDKSNRVFKGKRWKRREDDRSDPDRKKWKGKDRLVLDPVKICGAHLWVDKHLSLQEGPIVSNDLAAALRDANLTHVFLKDIEEG